MWYFERQRNENETTLDRGAERYTELARNVIATTPAQFNNINELIEKDFADVTFFG